ncbi:28 kDa heat- and acid-stable phosphoprotein-like [Hylaeus anthracinus]|uniref:28 kDa heat- and acid-stable phosphoprotein-like n=1 Tax=Hylaeus volcanicus TaxID=313075 RepID=UPI0023B879B8|nr:28 kDa heat- and acid-stable phosphoprotein-like [Hylaeus volcanicus]XP_053998024.1 28 kDa heat- and acid-stable phosphoprotein-like [Hylaeus anthracinus]
MPRGKFVGHKGRSRHFTNPEELEEQRRQDEIKFHMRKCKGDDASSSDEGGEETKSPLHSGSETDSESDSESESKAEGKAKGVENLIQVENPNRVQKKTKKLSELNKSVDFGKPELSRREREQLERQRAQANYQKLHAAGKTDEARADLARLAIIKQQREEAAKKREVEKKQKELAQQKKTELTQKALGKKS